MDTQTHKETFKQVKNNNTENIISFFIFIIRLNSGILKPQLLSDWSQLFMINQHIFIFTNNMFILT